MTRVLGFIGLAAAVFGVSAWVMVRPLAATPSEEEGPAPAVPAAVAEASAEQVHALCGNCHAYPPPDTFPRSAWRKEIKQGYDFLRDSALASPYPSLESVVRYYETRAPLEMPLPRPEDAPGEPPIRFNRRGFRPADAGVFPAVANVNLVHLFDKKRLDVLSCDMRSGEVSVLRPYETNPGWRVLAKLPVPCHAEVVDLDGDGNLDVIVACLGSFYPTDARGGSVVWLRGSADGAFTAIPLLEGLGRVADVQAADFNGDGKLDLVVAVFGWRKTGEILYLENRTKDWSKPVFEPHVVDNRHGAIHVPVCDLNGDGKPDFVALISQEHETIVAFLNEGNGHFRKETIYSAPHPAYGSSGIQLVDLNGDGMLDVLYTNGDSMDSNYLKPFHGVQWLENRGTFPFVHHPLTTMPGVMRAVAADLDGDGLLDVAAVSWLPRNLFPDRGKLGLDSVIVLHQTTPGQFARYWLEKGSCDHPTCAVGDLMGDGRLHLVTGNHYFRDPPPQADAISIWQNVTPEKARH
ncbi:MAG: FG-GAP repeat domain-containing protein [Gemmataceae bacterium]